MITGWHYSFLYLLFNLQMFTFSQTNPRIHRNELFDCSGKVLEDDMGIFCSALLVSSYLYCSNLWNHLTRKNIKRSLKLTTVCMMKTENEWLLLWTPEKWYDWIKDLRNHCLHVAESIKWILGSTNILRQLSMKDSHIEWHQWSCTQQQNRW